MEFGIIRFLFNFKPVRLLVVFALAFTLTLAACGNDYSVGGSVSGLTGTLVLQNNGGGDLSLTADGTFRFATKLADGKTYAVTISTQPSGQTCSVTNGSGKIGANVTNISIDCVDNPPDTIYSVGGSVSGLTGTLVLQNNGGDLSLNANGTFVFPSLLDANAVYDVTVLTQPSGQTCSVTSGSGTINGANIINVSVDCVDVASSGTISGTVSGTVIVAVNDSGTIVAIDDTAEKEPDDSGYPFTLTGIPVGVNIRVYLISESGDVFPLYFADPSTNVFSLSAVVDIDLGFVNTVSEQAIPENDPTAVEGVNPETENTVTPILPGGTLTVNVTDDNSGLPLSGATVVVEHASDPRQFGTTTEEGIIIFTTPSAGPVTVTIGMSDYEIETLISNIASLPMALEPMGLDFSAFVEGTADNFSGFGGYITSAFDLLNDGCPSCKNLNNEPIGFYRLHTDRPDRSFNLSAFDFGHVPPNFIAITGIGPLADDETFIWNPEFPLIPPATTSTTGTITVPASLVGGGIAEVGAVGLSDIGNQDKLIIGLTTGAGTASPNIYSYALSTFAFAGGTPADVVAWAKGTSGGETFAFRRGVGFGGTEVDFALLDLPTNLSPTGDCGSIAPTLSWDGVPGVSFYAVKLGSREVVIDGGTTSFTFPDLSGTDIAAMGLSPGVSVNWNVQAVVIPGYNSNTIDENTAMITVTDISKSADVTCTPVDGE